MADLPQWDKLNKGVIEVDYVKETPSTLEEYLIQNPHAGMLKVAVFTGRGLVPIPEARVYVTKLIGEDRVMMQKGLTDESGILDNIVLPAPSRSGSFFRDEGVRPYALYDIDIEHADYDAVSLNNVPIYEGIKSIQNISMTRKEMYNDNDT